MARPLSQLILTILCILSSYDAGAAQARPTAEKSQKIRESVQLSEILILTPKPYDDAQLEQARRKAEALRDEIRAGASFSQVFAKASQGTTAVSGGKLGTYFRGDLAPVLEDVVFRLKVGEVSEVIRTKQGFIILMVNARGGSEEHVESPFELLDEPLTPELEAFLKQMRSTIEPIWYGLAPAQAHPPQSKRGTLIVSVEILSDGSLGELKPITSTGDKSLDDAALQALRAASPFPRLPKSFTKDRLRIRARFEYNPDRGSRKPN